MCQVFRLCNTYPHPQLLCDPGGGGMDRSCPQSLANVWAWQSLRKDKLMDE